MYIYTASTFLIGTVLLSCKCKISKNSVNRIFLYTFYFCSPFNIFRDNNNIPSLYIELILILNRMHKNCAQGM